MSDQLDLQRPSRFARLMCRIFGHRWGVHGLTGQYVWCTRCAARKDAPQTGR